MYQIGQNSTGSMRPKTISRIIAGSATKPLTSSTLSDEEGSSTPDRMKNKICQRVDKFSCGSNAI